MFYTHCDTSRAHVVFLYRDFQSAAPDTYCHIGLGVGAKHSVAVLRRAQVRADVHGVFRPADVTRVLTGIPTATHVIIEAPWIPLPAMRALLTRFPDIHFVCRGHSQVGFLSVEPGAVRLIREYLGLQETALNFTMSGNSRRFCDFVEEIYRSRCLYLPNLYDLERVGRDDHSEVHMHRLLRIGSFGAMRLQKNHMVAAAVAMTIARRRRCDLEFSLSVNREEHGANVLAAIRNMYADVPGMKLVEVPWEPWASFRHVVANQDLCLQLSSTESFNLVTADAAAEGVASVVSHAIEWMPRRWMAGVDDSDEAASIGSALLSDRNAGREALRTLQNYASGATETWLRYLSSNPQNTCTRPLNPERLERPERYQISA